MLEHVDVRPAEDRLPLGAEQKLKKAHAHREVRSLPRYTHAVQNRCPASSDRVTTAPNANGSRRVCGCLRRIAEVDCRRERDEVEMLCARQRLVIDDVVQLARREKRREFRGIPAKQARWRSRLLRGNAAELAALLSAGELDYIIDYESLARAQHFNFIPLPAAIDLGDPTQAATYATASVRVGSGRDSITRHGAPILYGVSVPRQAPHFAVGVRFLQFLLGTEGQAILRGAHVDVLEHPELVGDSVPPALRAVVAP